MKRSLLGGQLRWLASLPQEWISAAVTDAQLRQHCHDALLRIESAIAAALAALIRPLLTFSPQAVRRSGAALAALDLPRLQLPLSPNSLLSFSPRSGERDALHVVVARVASLGSEKGMFALQTETDQLSLAGFCFSYGLPFGSKASWVTC